MKIKIYTGDRDAGKSTRFLSDYQKENKGICIFSKKKRGPEGKVYAYDLVLYPDNRTLPFFEKDPETDMETSTKEQLAVKMLDEHLMHSCSYFVHTEAFDAALDYYRTHRDTPLVWIDEIGRIEALGQGFKPLLDAVIADGKDLNIVMRRTFIDRMRPFLPADANIQIIDVTDPKSEN